MSEPSIPIPSATPPRSEAAATQALIAQIAAEARTSGQSIAFDPDAPVEGADGEPVAPRKGKLNGAGKKPAPATEGDDPDESQSHEKPEDDPEGDPEDPEQAAEGDPEGDPEEPAQSGSIDLSAVERALKAEGGVDMLALAKALGKEPEALGVSKGAAAFLRLERKKANETLKNAQETAQRLERDYGDQVRARKAASEGDLQPAIDYIEATFGLNWNELNKMVAGLLEGKPPKDLEKNRELLALRKREAERTAEEKQRAESLAQAEKVTRAKDWIKSQIKGDPLASVDLDKQLREAGFPGVVDLVFEAMQAGYSKGLTDPRKALDSVRQRLTRQAKALRSAGLVPRAKPAKPAPLSTSRPREDAQTGAAGNGRPMTDQELRVAVLKEAGLWRK